MTKRASYYEQLAAETDYPAVEDQIRKQCDICGLTIVINNWPDRKNRTPLIYRLIVCVDCDPRWWADRYKKEGFRIAFRRKLRVVNMARIVRAAARQGCINPLANQDGKCSCLGCAATKLFPNL